MFNGKMCNFLLRVIRSQNVSPHSYHCDVVAASVQANYLVPFVTTRTSVSFCLTPLNTCSHAQRTGRKLPYLSAKTLDAGSDNCCSLVQFRVCFSDCYKCYLYSTIYREFHSHAAQDFVLNILEYLV